MMEGVSNDSHSDSDSGESWTLLECSPSYNNTPLSLASPSANQAAVPSTEIIGDMEERDDDTDGISVISDCEYESVSTSSYEHVYREDMTPEHLDDRLHLTEQMINFTSGTEDPVTVEPEQSTDYENILGDASKLKIYVHKRNNKVSSMLNVILLGSVITAAGMALGHIWGVRLDCSEQSNSSVNKILSSLYKLQEENAFLRSKLKELTLASNFQLQQKKTSGKPKQCKKVFEEPLQSANVVKTNKCMDPDVDRMQPPIQFVKTELTLPPESTDRSTFESTVDEEDLKKERKKTMQNEKLMAKSQKVGKQQSQLQKKSKVDIVKKPKYNKGSIELGVIGIKQSQQYIPLETKRATEEPKSTKPVYIVSYADSLKHDFVRKHSVDNTEDIRKMEEWELRNNQPYKRKYREKHEKTIVEISDDENSSTSENQGIKKHKYVKPKNDHKYYRKQKRDNKYRQWEMKGGYLKDYDSVASLTSQDNLTPIDNKKPLSPDWDMYLNYMDKFSEFERHNANPEPVKTVTKTDFILVNKTARDTSSELKRIKHDHLRKSTREDTVEEDWFGKRSMMRRKARNELEKTMSIDSKLLMKSRWYFRRMKEREQLRDHTAHAAQSKNEHCHFN